MGSPKVVNALEKRGTGDFITSAIKYLKMESGGLVFAVVQRLPCGKPGTAPKEWD
jgi:hypothetical protein